MKQNCLKVKIGEYLFSISLFCHKKVGNTENMKFRLECEGREDLSQDFDDYEGVKEFLVKFIEEELDNLLIESLFEV